MNLFEHMRIKAEDKEDTHLWYQRHQKLIADDVPGYLFDKPALQAQIDYLKRRRLLLL